MLFEIMLNYIKLILMKYFYLKVNNVVMLDKKRKHLKLLLRSNDFHELIILGNISLGYGIKN